MNVNQLKDNLSKIKNPVWYKKNIGEILLTALKEWAPLYLYGTGLTNKKQNKKG